MPQQRRRYPDRSRSYSNSDPGAVFRNQNQNRNQQTSSFSQQQRSSNQQQISFNQQQNSRNQQQSPIKQTQSFAYEPFPTNNNSRSNYQGTLPKNKLLCPKNRSQWNSAQMNNQHPWQLKKLSPLLLYQF